VDLVMGPGQNFLTQVGSGQFFVAWVRSGQPFMVWVWIWKISPRNVKFSIFFPLGQKNLFGSGQKIPGSKAGRPLIYYGSKVSSGRVRAHLYVDFILGRSRAQVGRREFRLETTWPPRVAQGYWILCGDWSISSDGIIVLCCIDSGSVDARSTPL